MPDEARVIETDGGLEPEGEGWFVVDVRDTTRWRNDAFGASCPFEGNEDEKRRRTNATEARFAEYGKEAYARFRKWRRAPLDDSGLPWQ
jgi:hypothetical protein